MTTLSQWFQRVLRCKEQPAAGTQPETELDRSASIRLREMESLVKSHLKQGRTAAALKAARQGVEQGGAGPGFHNLLGVCLDRIGRHEEALAAFETELSRHPTHADARSRRDPQ